MLKHTSIVTCLLVVAYRHSKGCSVPAGAFPPGSQMGGRCARETALTFCHSPLSAPADMAHPVDALDHLYISLTFPKFAAEGL